MDNQIAELGIPGKLDALYSTLDSKIQDVHYAGTDEAAKGQREDP